MYYYYIKTNYYFLKYLFLEKLSRFVQSGVWSGSGAGPAGQLRVRGAEGTGGARRPAGFQPTLVALQQGAPHPITTLTINSSYGL